MSEKIAFCTLATGCYYEHGGTHNLVKSAKKFYPDIPFFIFSDNEIHDINAKYQDTMAEIIQSVNPSEKISPPYHPPCMSFYHSLIGRVVAKDHDLVIYLDSDSLIVDRLDEVFKNEYDVAGVRNNADNGHAGCGSSCNIDGTDVFTYVNGGFTACRRKEFWDEWTLEGLRLNYDHGMAEQHTLNLMFRSGKYKTLLLDPVDSKVYYGLASAYGDKKKVHQSHWDSWNYIQVIDNKLKLDGKTIKILHEGGGIASEKMKLDGGKIPPHVSEWIKKEVLA